MLTAQDKSQIVDELVKQAGSDKGGIMKNFLNTLAENNRLGLIKSVCDNYAALLSAHKGEIELVVTSAAVCGEVYTGHDQMS